MPIGQTKAKLDYFMGKSVDTLQRIESNYLFAKTLRHIPVLGAIARHLGLWDNFAFYTV